VTDTVGNTVPLSVNSDIGMMNEISPELIMNNEFNTFNLGTGINYIRKNFLGNARKLTLGSSIVAQNISEFIKNPTFADSAFYGYADARVSIEQPFLFGYPITTKLETYYTLQKRKEEYNSTIFGAKLSMDFELPDYVYLNSLNAYINLESSEYEYTEKQLAKLLSSWFQINNMPKEIADSSALDYVQNKLKSRNFSSTSAIMGVTFGANKTNDFLYPTSGYSLSFLVEDINSLASLINRIIGKSFDKPQSVKMVATSTFYPDLYSSKNDALGIKIKIGDIYTYRGDQIAVPINQRLYAGGSNSVRGWGSRELFPETANLDFGNSSREDLEAYLLKGAAPGGFFLFEGSIETRHKFLGRLGAAVFVDFGNTWNDIKEFNFNDLAIAAGFGFRYYSDFIPFRIDFGFKVFDPKDHRSLFKKQLWGELLQFHIGIGEAF
jgi:outer membrane protein insertion porin family